MTLMWFDCAQAVQAFARPDYERAVVPPAARMLRSRFDERSAHFDVGLPGRQRSDAEGPAT